MTRNSHKAKLTRPYQSKPKFKGQTNKNRDCVHPISKLNCIIGQAVIRSQFTLSVIRFLLIVVKLRVTFVNACYKIVMLLLSILISQSHCP